jgi:hypothetical protein
MFKFGRTYNEPNKNGRIYPRNILFNFDSDEIARQQKRDAFLLYEERQRRLELETQWERTYKREFNIKW